MDKGLLIGLEGLDGSGKSTQASLLKLYLDRQNRCVDIIKAKTKSEDRVFQNFIDKLDLKYDSVGYMFAYQSLHRRQYEKTKNAIDKGHIVIADRWDDSFFVYHNQFGVLADKPELRNNINYITFESMKPDIKFFLDISVDCSFSRRISRGDSKTFSVEEVEFYKKVHSEYKKLIADCVIIDGEQPIEEVNHQIISTVTEYL